METIISKIKIRRGKDEERKQIVFDEGEPVFAYDTGRLCIGDGQVSGGIPINKTHVLSGNNLSDINGAVIGDLAYVNDRLFVATSSEENINWEDASVKIKENGGLTFNNDNQLEIQSPNQPLEIINNQLLLNYDSTYFNANENKLTINEGVIPEYNFNSDDFSGDNNIGIKKVGAIQTINKPNTSGVEVDGTIYYNDVSTGVGVVISDPLTITTTTTEATIFTSFGSLDNDVKAALLTTSEFSGYSDDYSVGIVSSIETEALALKIDNNTLSVNNDGELMVNNNNNFNGNIIINPSGDTDYNGYQQYSNNFCTQFGHVFIDISASNRYGQLEAQLPKSYNNNNYAIQLTPENNNIDICCVTWKSSNSFRISIHTTDSSSSLPINNIPIYWTTNGFITQ